MKKTVFYLCLICLYLNSAALSGNHNKSRMHSLPPEDAVSSKWLNSINQIRDTGLEENINKLFTIDLIANSQGKVDPVRFIYKGVVDTESEPYLVDPAQFINRINGNSYSSISPDDNGQFFITQTYSEYIINMFGDIQRIRSPFIELRFGDDDAGLALDLWNTGAIFSVPFTIWDLNGTVTDQSDDIQLLPAVSTFFENDTSWGVRMDFTSSWSQNPAKSSDAIYIFYPATSFAEFEDAYRQQVTSGNIDDNIFERHFGDLYLKRITVNSVDANPLTTMNQINGLPRPAKGTVIRWDFSIALGFIPEDLYSFVGEDFSFKPAVKGHPAPEVSLISGPGGMTMDDGDVIHWMPTAQQTGLNEFTVEANNSQGSVQHTYQIWIDAMPWDFQMHNNNNITASVFNSGVFGRYFSDGAGFWFNGKNGLYHGQNFAGISHDQVSGIPHSAPEISEFATVSMVEAVESPFDGFDQGFRAIFDDSRAENPIGVKIIQNSYAKSTSPDDDYMILDYEIVNERPQELQNLHFGLYLDWDIGEFQNNNCGYDMARRLSYIYEENGANNPNYYGMSLLMGTLSGNTFEGPSRQEASDSLIFELMTQVETTTSHIGDYRPMLSSGPFNIPAGGSVRVVYAVLAGLTLTDLQTNTDAARAVDLTLAMPATPTLSAPANHAVNVPTEVALNWNPSDNATSYTLQISPASDFSADVTETSNITAESYTVSGLDQNTAYHWHVKAVNSNAESAWSDTWDFTTFRTAAAATETPESVSETGATLKGTVNTYGLETNLHFKYGLTDLFGMQVDADQNPVKSTSDVSVSADISGLQPDTTYYYKIFAVNDAGETAGDVMTFRTAGGAQAPVVTTRPATDIGYFTARLHGQINPNGLSTDIHFEYGETAAFGQSLPATPATSSHNGAIPVVTVLNDLKIGTKYYFRVFAENSGGSVNGETMTFTTEAYPQSVTVNGSFEFPLKDSPGDYSAGDYSLIGIPGNSKLSLSSVMDGSAGTDWIAYWDDGSENNYFKKFDGSNMFKCLTGRAFWAINKGTLSINRTVDSAPVTDAAEAEIDLHDGWNLITNPFNDEITWLVIRQANGISEPLFSYNGSFSQAAALRPYRGYYFDNAGNLATLKIPFRATLLKSAPQNQSGWQAAMQMECAAYADPLLQFGTSDDAERGYDRLDFRKPRSIGDQPAIYFDRSDWGEKFATVACDMRPPIAELEQWHFVVKSLPDESVTLKWSGIEDIPAEFSVYLIDGDRGRTQNMRSQQTYTYTPLSGYSRFQVAVGKQEAVESTLDQLTPKAWRLGKNFPNPFNPSTVIPVEVPADSRISLIVYDMLGKKIRVLQQGPVSAGKHQFIWDGCDQRGVSMPSGVYIYTLQSVGGLTRSGKMVLLR